MKTKHGFKSILKKIVAGAILVGTVATLSGCNRSLIDTKYGLDTALIVGDDAAIVCEVKEWRDYEGEQYQLNTGDGLVMLTASFDTDLFYGHSDTYAAQNFAQNAVSSDGEVYDLTTSDKNSLFNYDLIDTHWRYNKAATFNGNNAAVFNIAKWRDYEGEQLQIVTEDNMVLLLSSYNSKLMYDKQSNTKAEDFAQMYVGKDGVVTNIGNEVDTGLINYDLIDLNYNFNKIIIFKDGVAVILPISEWRDYEGEQLQVKVIGGPTMVTAAYDSILINDTRSTTKAEDVAKSLAGRVIDYSEGLESKEGFFNKTLIDLQYGFNNGIISNDRSATTIPITKWCDYEGEQLQVHLPNGDVMLTSSIYLDMLNGGSESINANTLASDYSSDKVIKKAENVTSSAVFNRQLLDLDMKFNYALHIENGNVTIIPLARWKDYYNSDGKRSEHISTNPDGTKHKVVTKEDDSPNCEQLQLELPDGTVLLTSAYDTILLKTSNIKDYAEMFKGADGVVTDLTPKFGEPTAGGWNIIIIDTKWRFNYAIYNNGLNSQVFGVSSWMDYEDGEQVQLKFEDGRGILTSYPNTTLVYAKDENKVMTIANAFAGVSLGDNQTYRLK